MQEHLVWGRPGAPMSPGSTVLVEPTSSKSIKYNIPARNKCTNNAAALLHRTLQHVSLKWQETNNEQAAVSVCVSSQVLLNSALGK